MSKQVVITLGETEFVAEFYLNQTADAIYDILPIELPYQVWGDEIYFHVPVEVAEQGDSDIVEVGELAFWPPGKAFCIFYGPTPASTDERPRAASVVTAFGKIQGDATILCDLRADTIRVEKLDEPSS